MEEKTKNFYEVKKLLCETLKDYSIYKSDVILAMK